MSWIELDEEDLGEVKSVEGFPFGFYAERDRAREQDIFQQHKAIGVLQKAVLLRHQD